MAKANRKNSTRSKRTRSQSAQRRGTRSDVRDVATAMSRMSAGAAQLQRSANATGRKIVRGLGSTVEDNPMMIGAALFVSGAALGYVLRGMLRDGMWLEEQRDAVVDKARELARTATDKVNNLRHHRNGESNEAQY